MSRFALLILFLLVAGCTRFEDSGIASDFDRSELILLHNQERGLNKITQLQHDQLLDERAQKHAEWMANNGLLVHSKMDMSGIDFYTMGENIAMGHEDAISVVKDWMESPGHRRNILNKKYTHIGFGYAKKQGGRPYWCALFGGR